MTGGLSLTPAQGGSRPDPAAIEVPAGALQEYVGHYQVSYHEETATAIYLRNGALVMDAERVYPTVLKAESKDHFFCAGITGAHSLPA